MIVLGADTHKGSHALAAVNEGTGRVRGGREIKADEPGHLAAVRWARGLDEQRVWAIEDCRHVSRRLEQALLAAGERVVRVAPHRMGASRKGERERGKSDQIDALAIARAYGADSARLALRAALAREPAPRRRDSRASRATARSPACTTPTCRSGSRSPGGRTSGLPDLLAGRLLDREGRATGERPLLVDEGSISSRPGSRCGSTSRRTPTRRWRGARSTRSRPS
jgi:hypothetical protein